jgi:predicted CXXCH cytochrome family protein
MTPDAYSANEPGAVTCSSCHSPHRGSRQAAGTEGFPGRRKVSPRDPRRFEFELCESCHGDAGVTTQSLTDISRMLDPNNRSFHPVEAPAGGTAPSVVPDLAGREINCTDCHGNADRSGPKGPHGSSVHHLLRFPYTTVDGSSESQAVYRLCYSCHVRRDVLSSTRFPEHALHVVEERASCATCHNPHGSVGNRALIRFGEETFISGVSPSVSTGTLDYVSDAPGSGVCYLTCHGEDHAPEAYGTGAEALRILEAADRYGLPAPSPAGPEDRTPFSAPDHPRPDDRPDPPPP